MGRVPGNSYCHLLPKQCVVIPVNPEYHIHILSVDRMLRAPSVSPDPPAPPQGSSLCASGSAEGNAVLTRIFSLQPKLFGHACFLPRYAEGPYILCCVKSASQLT